MNMRMSEEGLWILPAEGSLGNKAANLMNAQREIEKAGFEIPKSMVLPHEYLAAVPDRVCYVINQVARWFPGVMSVALRSNATDEDKGKRKPGEFASEILRMEKVSWESYKSFVWWRRRGIDTVINSYDTPRRRMMRLLTWEQEGGMSLLVQRFLNADVVGSYSDLGEYGELLIGHEDSAMLAMSSMPKSLHTVVDGKTEDSSVDPDLVSRLHSLSRELREKNGSPFEIEFVAEADKSYVVQATPITLSEMVDSGASGQKVVDVYRSVGRREMIANGILVVPYLNEEYFDKLLEFDITHENYCIILQQHWLQSSGRFTSLSNDKEIRGSIVDIAQNASAIIVVGWFTGDLPGHLRNFMRYDRVGVYGHLTNALGEVINAGSLHMEVNGDNEPSFSGTKVLIAADERTQSGRVELLEPLADFKELPEARYSVSDIN